MKRKIMSLVCVVVFLMMASACATATRVQDAESSFTQAKNLGAEQKAPFEYYAAEAYLEYARHEKDEGDAKQSNAFAEESIKYADQAIQKSGGAK